MRGFWYAWLLLFFMPFRAWGISPMPVPQDERLPDLNTYRGAAEAFADEIRVSGVTGPQVAIVPRHAPRALVFEGAEVLFYVPETPPRALIFLFHGTQGNARFVEKLEPRRTINRLEDAGFAWVSATALDTTEPRKWNVDDLDAKTNTDLARLLRIRDKLIKTSAVDANTPLLTMGMSNGGAMASSSAHAFRDLGLPIVATANYAGPVRQVVLRGEGVQVPTMFVLMENDAKVDNEVITATVRRTRESGVDADLLLATEGAMSPDRLLRIPGMNAAQAARAFEALVTGGLLDADGRRTIEQPDVSRAVRGLTGFPVALRPYARAMADQLGVAWATHEFSSAFDDRLLVFFDAHLRRAAAR